MNTREEMLKRFAHLELLKDPNAAAVEREMCARDVKHFVNSWCFTFDPRRPPKNFPFILYAFQSELFDWLDERYKQKETGLIEKSRDMGLTWCVAAWSVHKWLFGSGFHALFGSRTEKLVDDKTINSIFGKIRYIIYRLPDFLRPKIESESNTDAYMRLINPDNDNQIVGESTNINFGRGGRSSICFLDEFAHVEHSEVIWASISENSDCIIPLSTPNGKGNEFGRLKHENKVPVKSIHWSLHPLKTQDWYEKKKRDMRPWQIAQELDLSYERSKRGIIYQRFDRKWHVTRETIRYNPDFEQFVTWDFGIADPTAILWGQITTEGKVQIIQCFEMEGWDIDFFAPISKGARPKEWPLLSEDQKAAIQSAIGKIPSVNDATHYGDHSGTARTANSKRSCRDALKDHGIKLISSGKQTHDWRFDCLDALLKLRFNQTRKEWYSIFEISPDCQRLIDCLLNYVWDAEDEVNDTNIKPRHDWASHMVTALEFFAINRFPISKPLEHRTQRIR